MRLPSPFTSGREREQRKEQKMKRDAAKTGWKDDMDELNTSGKEEGISPERRKRPLFSPELRTGEDLREETIFLTCEFEQRKLLSFSLSSEALQAYFCAQAVTSRGGSAVQAKPVLVHYLPLGSY